MPMPMPTPMSGAGAGAGTVAEAARARPAAPSSDASGVGVLDKCVDLLWAVRSGATSVAQVAARADVSRPTAHRLLGALLARGLVSRDGSGELSIGPGLLALAAGSATEVLIACAGPVLRELCAVTGQSAHLFRRASDVRVCVASAEPAAGLLDALPVGTALPLTAGSAAKVLLAWPDAVRAADGSRGAGLVAPFDEATLAAVRSAGYALSVAEREPGLASASAPVWLRGEMLAALCVAGPSERLAYELEERVAPLVVAAADALGERLWQLTGAA